jgi:PKD repeat protein
MRRIILTIATALIGLLLLGMAACGRRGNKTPGQGAVLHSSQTTTIQDALAQLDALEKPEGVDAKLWNELKGALKSALTTKNHQPTTRTTSTPPTGDINKVNDFAISDHGDGSYTLSWHYRNLGDYDQNGVVGVSDITPLAMHFGKTYNFELEANTIQAVADGSLNGTVGIEDVTQIAMYFGTECAGYFLRTSPAPPASVEETTELDFLPLDLAQGEGRIAYGADHPLPSHTYIAVAPVDGDGVLGELSNVVLSPNHSPGAALTVDPAEGDAPLTVGLDAGESSDMDGPIAKYEWDFEGDGVWDEDSGTLSYVEHVYETPDFYYPVVRVTDAEGAQDTAEASVFAGQWRISTAVTGLWGDAGATSLEVVNGNPAICFYGRIVGAPDGGYLYVQANNPLGEAWNSPILVYGGMVAGVSECDDTLAVVNDRPVIAALDGDDSSLNYALAEDTDGVAWGTPREVCAASTGGNEISLAIIDGKPAVAYEYSRLKFIRALDADGTAWGTPIEVSVEGTIPSLSIVNGYPAITYSNSNGLCYVRATDTDGDTWGEPIVVDAQAGGTSSLAVINGKPAIVYTAAVYISGWVNLVKYAISSDEIGLAWGTPVTLAQDAELGFDRSLAFIKGRPAICCVGVSDKSLKYFQAADSDGYDWREPVIVRADDVGLHGACLAEVNGCPAISYITGTGGAKLRFAMYY